MLLSGALTSTHAIPITSFEPAQAADVAAELIPVPSVDEGATREAVEAPSGWIAQILCLTECSPESSRDVLATFMLALLSPAPSPFTMHKVTVLFLPEKETGPHFGYYFLPFESGLPTRGPGGDRRQGEESP